MLVFLCSFALPSFAAEADPVEEPEAETIAGYTLEELVTAFQNGDSEVMEAYLAATAHYQDEQEVPTGPQPRWKSGNNDPNTDTATHGHITALALLLYIGDMQNIFGISGNYGYKISEWAELERSTGKPDGALESLNLLLSDHFYDPDTGKSWRESSSITARTRANEYYVEAMQTYSSNRAKALDNLGRALHFVQDVCEPHHAANIKATDKDNQHSSFEAYAATRLPIISENFTAASNPSLYSFCLSNAPGALVHKAAITAKSYAGLANAPQNSNWAWVADTTLVNAVYYSAALLYKFAKEVHMI